MKEFNFRCMNDCFYGSVTVGERGQVVIPAEARAEFDIKPGDKLLMMKHPLYDGLMMAKLEALQGFLDDFRRSVEQMSKESLSEDLK